MAVGRLNRAMPVYTLHSLRTTMCDVVKLLSLRQRTTTDFFRGPELPCGQRLGPNDPGQQRMKRSHQGLCS